MKLWAFLFLAALAFTSTAAAQPTGNPAAISVGKQAIAVATASSHCPIDPISALNDGREPGSSQDRGIPHLSFYARVGTFEWLQYDFPAAQTFEGCEVYWSDDQDIPKKSPRDRGLGLPEFWKVLYLSETGEWLPVAGQPPPPFLDGWNVCRFTPVRTKALRLAVQQSSLASAGVLEWKVMPTPEGAVVNNNLPEEINLDDLIPFTENVGSGSYRVNKYSSREEKAGHRVLLDGAPCRRFLFCHANSAVSFAVPAGFSRFSATGVGPTGANWNNYSWTYQILADGRLLYQSELLDSYPGKQVRMVVELPAGTKTLTLVTDGSGNLTADHSCWAEPKLRQPAVSPETKAKLLQLETEFQAACLKALAPLRQSYLAAVQRALEKAQKDFDADAMPALEGEMKMLKAGQAVLSLDAPETPESLAKLRTTYRTAVAAARAKAASPLAQVHDRYEAALTELSATLTANPTDTAAVVAVVTPLRAGRPAAVVAEPSVPPGKSLAAPEKPAAPALAVTASSMARLRQLAEKVVALNPNGLRLIVERQLVAHTKLPLPAGAFEIQEIGVGGAAAKSITDADLDLLGAGRGAQIIQLNDAPLTRLDGLKPHAGLRILSFSGTALTDDALKALGEMRLLEQLHLNGTKIAGSGLSTLAGCNKLSFLSLWGTQLDDSSLTHLSGLRSLTRLNIGNTKVTGSTLAQLSGLSNLVYLGIDSLVLGPEAMEELPKLKHLTELDLNSAKLSGSALARVGGMTGLEKLTLSNTSVNGSVVADAELRELAGLTKLKELILNFTAITGTGLAALAKLSNLESLSIAESSYLTDEGLQVALKTFPALTTLVLGGKITGTSIGNLNQCTKLKNLILNGPDLVDAAVNALPPLRNLESLELRSPKLTSALSAAVARQPKLIRLHLNGTGFDDAAIPDLCRMKGLKQLNLSGLSISPANLDKLRKTLPACQVIR